MKSKLKDIYYQFLKLKSRVQNGRPVLVLMYHRVNNAFGDKLNDLTVSVTNFEEQLKYYKDRYQILRLEEDWNSLKRTGLVITFDDGYADNIINALPLLEKYQIPATIFVTTLNINTKNEFWWDRLVFDYSTCDEMFFLPNMKNKVLKSNLIYKEIVAQLDKLNNEEKEKWLLKFEKINQISYLPREEYRSLTNFELKTLSKHPLISIGIHSHNHYPLGNLTYDLQRKEFELSIQKLKGITEPYIKYFALPHGSYNESTFRIAEEFNLEGILLANDYYSSKKNKSLKKINRILMPNIIGEEIVKRLRKFE